MCRAGLGGDQPRLRRRIPLRRSRPGSDRGTVVRPYRQLVVTRGHDRAGGRRPARADLGRDARRPSTRPPQPAAAGGHGGRNDPAGAGAVVRLGRRRRKALGSGGHPAARRLSCCCTSKFAVGRFQHDRMGSVRPDWRRIGGGRLLAWRHRRLVAGGNRGRHRRGCGGGRSDGAATSVWKAEQLDDAVIAACRVAAVDCDRLTGDKRRVGGHQKGRHRGDLVRPAAAPKCVLLRDRLQRGCHALEAHHAVQHRCVDESGADGVRPDTARAVVERNVLGEEHNSALGRVVCATARCAFETLDTRERHDRAALAVDTALLDHLGDGRLGHQEGAGEVDSDDALPLGLRE